MNRRAFIGNALKGTASAWVVPTLVGCRTKRSLTYKIDRIELFRYDINVPRYFSWGAWRNRQHVFMKMISGAHSGWAEVAASKNNPDFNLREWSVFLNDFLQMPLGEAYNIIRSNQYGNGKVSNFSKKQMEFMEMALLDLQGKIEGRPAIEILGMHNRTPVSGLYCILDSNLDRVKKAIESCQEQGLDQFVKFKIYGNPELDREIISLGRSLLGPEAFILADANRGYKNWNSIGELSSAINDLKAVGLNAIEDPSELSNEDWIILQRNVQPLALVPDYAMRPAWKGIERVEPGMGEIFNFHPESMGSLRFLGDFARKVKSFGGKLMIGDASLVGPACSVWQQIAIGVGAEWVEALEKVEASADFMKCVKFKPTYRDAEGRFAYVSAPGFGLEIDDDKLRFFCKENILINPA